MVRPTRRKTVGRHLGRHPWDSLGSGGNSDIMGHPPPTLGKGELPTLGGATNQGPPVTRCSATRADLVGKRVREELIGEQVREGDKLTLGEATNQVPPARRCSTTRTRRRVSLRFSLGDEGGFPVKAVLGKTLGKAGPRRKPTLGDSTLGPERARGRDSKVLGKLGRPLGSSSSLGCFPPSLRGLLGKGAAEPRRPLGRQARRKGCWLLWVRSSRGSEGRRFEP